MSATDIHPTTATTYNGWANKATWLASVYLYDDLYEQARMWIGAHYEVQGSDEIDKSYLVGLVEENLSNTMREYLLDAIEEVDYGKDSDVRAMVWDFLSLTIYDVNTHELATHIVENYLSGYEIWIDD